MLYIIVHEMKDACCKGLITAGLPQLVRRTCCSCQGSHEGGLAHARAALQEHAAPQLQRAQHAQRVAGRRGRAKLKGRPMLHILLGPSRYKKWRDAKCMIWCHR